MKKIICILIALLLLSACSGRAATETLAPAEVSETVTAEAAAEAEGEAQAASGEGTLAVYLGVEHYGAEETNKDNRDSFTYRFDIGGEETVLRLDNGPQDAEGNYSYPIQNQLKEGYAYRLTLEGDTVTAVTEVEELEPYTPLVQGVPGEGTLTNFLKTALEPVGTTLYIYGGGWDWQDEGSSAQARTLGVSPDWVRFYQSQDEQYTYKERDGNPDIQNPERSYFPYGGYNEYYYAGLDCSGYLGWVLYNTFETEDGAEGYVGGSTGFAKRLAERGWGTWTQDVQAPDGHGGGTMRPGDLMSINGHVWISLGTCADGSVVILHCTPSYSRAGQPGGGVQLSAIGGGEDCEAYRLAERYLSEYYPDWFSRYPVYLCDPAVYFTFEGESAGKFTWDTENGPVSDPDGLREMTPDAVLEILFAQSKA